MPSVTIPDETFARLVIRATALNLTVEQLIAPMLDLVAAGIDGDFIQTPSRSFDEWKKKFDAWMTEVETRIDRYPPGFVMDDSRGSIYEGGGE